MLPPVLFVLGLCPADRGVTRADEGMWLFNRPPRELLRDKYGFELTDSWLEHFQQSAVRFNNGGSASFVSPHGLVLTNHHVGADALQKLSTVGSDYLQQGFFARTPADEIKCVDLELNVLQGIEDVTTQVNAAVAPDVDPAAAQRARRAVMNTLEQESLEKTGLRSDVVTLYQGGQYHLYRYKKYTDVRLVFAPEQAIAFFGGDPDNFEYPRYDLDICFFRVYEDDAPARVDHFLTWSDHGAEDGELIFVAGHPARTDRLNTLDHLEFLRDCVEPAALNVLRRREVLLQTWSERSLENARRAQDDLFGIQNSRKARLGGLAGLQDPHLLGRKQAAEEQFLAALPRQGPHAVARAAFDDVRAALDVHREILLPHTLLERGSAFNSDLFGIARTLVRLAEEDSKPNSERLREYRASNRESLELTLFSEAPVYDDLETVRLADSLSMLLEQVGADDPLVQTVLAGASPRDRAAQLVQGTRLKYVGERRRFAAGGVQALAEASDPLIELARTVDGPARAVRATYEERVEEPLRQAYARIAQARFALSGPGAYPDATFTLRLAYGVVRGYRERGESVPPWTTLGGAFRHSEAHGGKDPFALPPAWHAARERLDLNTPFNFVSTADIIGGNSGSPVVNRQGDVVGIIFDGNIHSLVLDFLYSDDQARAISVHSSAIVQALRRVYRADRVADELQGIAVD